jgi:sugar phosphate permease
MEVELNVAHEPMGNIASVYFIAYTIMTFVWGIIADRIGPRKCIIIGQLSILVGLAGMGFMTSLPAGFLFYALSGTGAAGQNAPAVRLLSDWFSGARRGRALGIAMAGAGAVTMVLGLVVPIVLVSYSWRWGWWLGAALVFVAAVICWLSLVDTPAERGLARVGANNKGFSVSSREHVAERGEPLAPEVTIGDILKGGTIWRLGGLFFMRGIGYVTVMTFAVAYLKEIGWGVRAAAGALATWGALQIPGPIIWGIASDRITKKYLLAIALALEAIGMFVFLGGGTVSSYAGAAIIGLGDSGIPTVLAASMADYYEPTTIGTTWGFTTLLFGISAIISPTLGGAIADATGTLYTTILGGLGAVVVAFILALTLKKPPPQPQS